MAVYNDTFTAAHSHGFFNTISRFGRGVVATFMHWNDTRKTRNALVRLSDRELNDIGLSRGDVFNLR